MTQYPSSAKVFFPNGRSLEAGEVLVQKNLATTFKQLAEGGFDAFYKGAIAEAITDYVQQHGGVITKADLASYDVVWREPYRSTYRGYEVVAAPPPTAAIHVLQQLNIVSNYDLAKMGYHSADGLHVMIEATKLAGADRRRMGGDPDFVEMPIRGLLSKKYAAERQALIDMGRAMTPKYGAGNAHAYESEDTTHFVVLDQWGNMVSCTTTLGSGFGSLEVVEGTGILLQNRTWWMALDTGPNVVEPNRRANIGHSPILIFKDGKPFMAVGSPGGDTIRQTVFQGIVNVIDFGLNMQQAVEAARFAADPLVNRVRIESRISADVLAELERRGHQLERAAPWRGSETWSASRLMHRPGSSWAATTLVGTRWPSDGSVGDDLVFFETTWPFPYESLSYSLTGPKSGGGRRCLVAASYAEAARRIIGSSPGPAQNEIPTGSGESSRVCRLLVTLS